MHQLGPITGGVIVQVLKAAIRGALAAGKTEVSESELVQIARPLVIGTRNVVTISGSAAEDKLLGTLVSECVALVAANPGLSLSISVGVDGQRVIRFEHPPAWLVADSQESQSAAVSKPPAHLVLESKLGPTRDLPGWVVPAPMAADPVPEVVRGRPVRGADSLDASDNPEPGVSREEFEELVRELHVDPVPRRPTLSTPKPPTAVRSDHVPPDDIVNPEPPIVEQRVLSVEDTVVVMTPAGVARARGSRSAMVPKRGSPPHGIAKRSAAKRR